MSPLANVVVAISDIRARFLLPQGVEANVTIPAGHKIAIAPISQGEKITKYGQTIAEATTEIAQGDQLANEFAP